MKTLTPIFLLIALVVSPQVSLAQVPQVSLPQEQQHINFVDQFLKDERAIWDSPFKIRRGDAKWLAPLAAGAAALLVTDWKFSQHVREKQSVRPASKFLSNFGSDPAILGASGAMLAIGKWSHNEKAAETGSLALKAVLHTQLVVQSLKMITNRERPDKLQGHGSFLGGGRSFPSGHAASSFAFATVVADQYRDKPWVGIGAYGVATAVSLSRVGGMRHFPSDVVIGASIGYLISHYILHRHHEAELR